MPKEMIQSRRKSEAKSKVIQIRVTPRQYEILDELCEEIGQDALSDLMKSLISISADMCNDIFKSINSDNPEHQIYCSRLGVDIKSKEFKLQKQAISYLFSNLAVCFSPKPKI